jgi:hypothetical protein
MSMFEEFDQENPDDEAPAGAGAQTVGPAFQAKGAARASKAFRDAAKDGKAPSVVQAKDGYRIQIEAAAEAKSSDSPSIAKPQIKSTVDSLAHEAATSPHNDRKEPSQAQKEAGNYKKGRVNVQGLDIAIENPRGSDRSGVDPDGNEWTHTMSDHYGYIRKTMGADGDQLDVYVGPKPDSDKVFVIDQADQKAGHFDEHKIMIGFANQRAAIKAYEANFDEGWTVGPVTEMSMPDFKAWVREGETSQPMSKEIKVAEAKPDDEKPDKKQEPEVVAVVEPEPEKPPVTAASKARTQAMGLAKKVA